MLVSCRGDDQISIQPPCLGRFDYARNLVPRYAHFRDGAEEHVGCDGTCQQIAAAGMSREPEAAYQGDRG